MAMVMIGNRGFSACELLLDMSGPPDGIREWANNGSEKVDDRILFSACSTLPFSDGIMFAFDRRPQHPKRTQRSPSFRVDEGPSSACRLPIIPVTSKTAEGFSS